MGLSSYYFVRSTLILAFGGADDVVVEEYLRWIGVEDIDDRQVGGQVNSRWSTIGGIDSKNQSFAFSNGV